MTQLRGVILLLFMAAIATLGGDFQLGQSSAQASTQMSENSSARDASTSREDINLTNSCIDAGQSKAHCLCVTKIFKYQMSLREYMAAVQLYGTGFNPDPTVRSATKISLRQRGYRDQEIVNIENFQIQLLDKTDLEKRCEIAADYYAYSSL